MNDSQNAAIGIGRYPVMPSLVALQQIRNRLNLAHLGKKLMKWTALATGREMRKTARDLAYTYGDFDEDLANAYIQLARCRFYYPLLNQQTISNPQKHAHITLTTAAKTISGVKVLQFEVNETEDAPAYPYLGLSNGGQSIKEAKDKWSELLKRMILISQLRNTFTSLENAHKSATKKQNVLQKIIIPKLIATLQYILSELEEKEREELFRLKRFKQLKTKVANDSLRMCTCCLKYFNIGDKAEAPICSVCANSIKKRAGGVKLSFEPCENVGKDLLEYLDKHLDDIQQLARRFQGKSCCIDDGGVTCPPSGQPIPMFDKIDISFMNKIIKPTVEESPKVPEEPVNEKTCKTCVPIPALISPSSPVSPQSEKIKPIPPPGPVVTKILQHESIQIKAPPFRLHCPSLDLAKVQWIFTSCKTETKDDFVCDSPCSCDTSFASSTSQTCRSPSLESPCSWCQTNERTCTQASWFDWLFSPIILRNSRCRVQQLSEPHDSCRHQNVVCPNSHNDELQCHGNNFEYNQQAKAEQDMSHSSPCESCEKVNSSIEWLFSAIRHPSFDESCCQPEPICGVPSPQKSDTDWVFAKSAEQRKQKYSRGVYRPPEQSKPCADRSSTRCHICKSVINLTEVNDNYNESGSTLTCAECRKRKTELNKSKSPCGQTRTKSWADAAAHAAECDTCKMALDVGKVTAKSVKKSVDAYTTTLYEKASHLLSTVASHLSYVERASCQLSQLPKPCSNAPDNKCSMCKELKTKYPVLYSNDTHGDWLFLKWKKQGAVEQTTSQASCHSQSSSKSCPEKKNDKLISLTYPKKSYCDWVFKNSEENIKVEQKVKVAEETKKNSCISCGKKIDTMPSSASTQKLNNDTVCKPRERKKVEIDSPKNNMICNKCEKKSKTKLSRENEQQTEQIIPKTSCDKCKNKRAVTQSFNVKAHRQTCNDGKEQKKDEQMCSMSVNRTSRDHTFAGTLYKKASQLLAVVTGMVMTEPSRSSSNLNKAASGGLIDIGCLKCKSQHVEYATKSICRPPNPNKLCSEQPSDKCIPCVTILSSTSSNCTLRKTDQSIPPLKISCHSIQTNKPCPDTTDTEKTCSKQVDATYFMTIVEKPSLTEEKDKVSTKPKKLCLEPILKEVKKTDTETLVPLNLTLPQECPIHKKPFPCILCHPKGKTVHPKRLMESTLFLNNQPSATKDCAEVDPEKVVCPQTDYAAPSESNKSSKTTCSYKTVSSCVSDASRTSSIIKTKQNQEVVEKMEKVIKIKRIRNPDGTVSEQKKITIKTNRKVPTKEKSRISDTADSCNESLKSYPVDRSDASSSCFEVKSVTTEDEIRDKPSGDIDKKLCTTSSGNMIESQLNEIFNKDLKNESCNVYSNKCDKPKVKSKFKPNGDNNVQKHDKAKENTSVEPETNEIYKDESIDAYECDSECSKTLKQLQYKLLESWDTMSVKKNIRSSSNPRFCTSNYSDQCRLTPNLNVVSNISNRDSKTYKDSEIKQLPTIPPASAVAPPSPPDKTKNQPKSDSAQMNTCTLNLPSCVFSSCHDRTLSQMLSELFSSEPNITDIKSNILCSQSRMYDPELRSCISDSPMSMMKYMIHPESSIDSTSNVKFTSKPMRMAKKNMSNKTHDHPNINIRNIYLCDDEESVESNDKKQEKKDNKSIVQLCRIGVMQYVTSGIQACCYDATRKSSINSLVVDFINAENGNEAIIREKFDNFTGHTALNAYEQHDLLDLEIPNVCGTGTSSKENRVDPDDKARNKSETDKTKDANLYDREKSDYFLVQTQTPRQPTKVLVERNMSEQSNVNRPEKCKRTKSCNNNSAHSIRYNRNQNEIDSEKSRSTDVINCGSGRSICKNCLLELSGLIPPSFGKYTKYPTCNVCQSKLNKMTVTNCDICETCKSNKEDRPKDRRIIDQLESFTSPEGQGSLDHICIDLASSEKSIKVSQCCQLKSCRYTNISTSPISQEEEAIAQTVIDYRNQAFDEDQIEITAALVGRIENELQIDSLENHDDANIKVKRCPKCHESYHTEHLICAKCLKMSCQYGLKNAIQETEKLEAQTVTKEQQPNKTKHGEGSRSCGKKVEKSCPECKYSDNIKFSENNSCIYVVPKLDREICKISEYTSTTAADIDVPLSNFNSDRTIKAHANYKDWLT